MYWAKSNSEISYTEEDWCFCQTTPCSGKGFMSKTGNASCPAHQITQQPVTGTSVSLHGVSMHTCLPRYTSKTWNNRKGKNERVSIKSDLHILHLGCSHSEALLFSFKIWVDQPMCTEKKASCKPIPEFQLLKNFLVWKLRVSKQCKKNLLKLLLIYTLFWTFCFSTVYSTRKVVKLVSVTAI